MADANGRKMAQNYDPETGIAIMNACAPNCRFPCTPVCPLDPERDTHAVFGPPGLDFTPDDWTVWTHGPVSRQAVTRREHPRQGPPHHHRPRHRRRDLLRPTGAPPMKNAFARFVDWVLGPRCHNCTHRVFPRDLVRHYLECPGAIR